MDSNQLTATAQKNLVESLIRFGNTLSMPHRKALYSLNDMFTKLATGQATGRWAFGLPTGTGKTRAIVEWSTAVHTLGLPYSFAVSASQVAALQNLKQDMIDNGIPESKIGLLYHGKREGLQATPDNDERPYMLITHQRVRANAMNLKQYNTYNGQPRDLLIYDESLITSDITHFEYDDLREALAGKIERVRGEAEHADIRNFMTECLAQIVWAYQEYDTETAQYIRQPELDPAIAEACATKWEKDKLISNFLRAANSDLRLVKSGKSAIVSYRIVIPASLTNIIVLDASYPIRTLCHFDTTIKSAETLSAVRQLGVSFHDIKRFDNVELYRLRAYGGRCSMEKGFKSDRKMAKEVVEVVKTIPTDEAILLYVYKLNQPRGVNYADTLRRELEAADISTTSTTPEGKPRIVIQTWGNETSLNTYGYCSHVFLVGILHRAETELMAQYLGQKDDLQAAFTKTTTDDLQRSEKAHLAYQALSRGSCRMIDNGQARPMKGYLVEIDPQIETSLTSVMPGVKWHKWTPFFVEETDSLIDTWTEKIRAYLSGVDRISSRGLKKALEADNVSGRTWTRIIQQFLQQRHVPKDVTESGGVLERRHVPKEEDVMESGGVWRLEGQSLVRRTAESLGFEKMA